MTWAFLWILDWLGMLRKVAIAYYPQGKDGHSCEFRIDLEHVWKGAVDPWSDLTYVFKHYWSLLLRDHGNPLRRRSFWLFGDLVEAIAQSIHILAGLYFLYCNWTLAVDFLYLFIFLPLTFMFIFMKYFL